MYCVYLTIYKGEKLPRRYIGSCKISRIRSGYNGSISSKKWSTIYKYEQTNNKHLFKTRILSVHETSVSALNEELRLHLAYDVVQSKDFMNESLARVNGFFGRDVSGENNPMYGSNRSGEKHEGGENISRGLKNYYSSERSLSHRESTRKRLLENPISTPEILANNIRLWKERGRNVGEKNPMFGKVGKLKGKTLYNNGVVVRAFFPGEAPEGWSKGRIPK